MGRVKSSSGSGKHNYLKGNVKNNIAPASKGCKPLYTEAELAALIKKRREKGL